jgi:hypothetical protein
MSYFLEARYPLLQPKDVKAFWIMIEENNIHNKWMDDYLLGGEDILLCVYPHSDTSLNYIEYRDEQINLLKKKYRKQKTMYNYMMMVSYGYLAKVQRGSNFRINWNLMNYQEEFTIDFNNF